jgi:hypothetical protein
MACSSAHTTTYAQSIKRKHSVAESNLRGLIYDFCKVSSIFRLVCFVSIWIHFKYDFVGQKVIKCSHTCFSDCSNFTTGPTKHIIAQSLEVHGAFKASAIYINKISMDITHIRFFLRQYGRYGRYRNQNITLKNCKQSLLVLFCLCVFTSSCFFLIKLMSKCLNLSFKT